MPHLNFVPVYLLGKAKTSLGMLQSLYFSHACAMFRASANFLLMFPSGTHNREHCTKVKPTIT